MASIHLRAEKTIIFVGKHVRKHIWRVNIPIENICHTKLNYGTHLTANGCTVMLLPTNLPRICKWGGKSQQQNKTANYWPELHIIAIQTRPRSYTGRFAFCKIPQTHLLDKSRSNYIAAVTWEAGVKQIKLKALCIIVDQCRPLQIKTSFSFSTKKSSRCTTLLSPSQQRPRQCQAK